MCLDQTPIFSAAFSLLGSFLLVWPAYRASKMLMLGFSLSKIGQGGIAFDEGIKATAAAIEKGAGKWTPSYHWLLIAGILCMGLGGLLGLIHALCDAPLTWGPSVPVNHL